jgi:adenosylmethionine---8-amino-7-oxononanoate aminotransferase
LSERLAALAPAGLGHAFYGSDGASATEIALKMSFHYWRNRGRPNKRQFISLAGSYHGETLGALAVTDVALFRDVYAPLLNRNATVPCPHRRQAMPADAPDVGALEAADAFERHLAEYHDVTAALIVEPLIQGASGMTMYDPVYLLRARELCKRYDVHLIADEIMTGFGRTGTMFAWEQVVGSQRDSAVANANLSPDFLCLSKGITGGFLPLSCVLVTDEVYAAFYADEITRGFLHSHSYTGNPLACAAALAVLDIFAQDHVIATNYAKTARFNALAAPLAAHPNVRDFRNLGMVWAFEVDSNRTDFARWLFVQALNREILLRPIGHTIYFMPPYVVSDAEFAFLVAQTLALVDQA